MERNQPQPPKETRMFRSVSHQAIADLLRTLPTPITITQYLDTERETLFYRYQVGKTTHENPAGIRMGAAPHFLDAVKLSLEAVMGRQQEGAEEQGTRRAQSKPGTQAPAPVDEWIVPEVERGEASATQAAALGLPYRHRVTGETIAAWTERTLDADAARQARDSGETDKQERELITLLRNLPLSITITKRDDSYIWQVLEESGTSEDFVGVVGYSLHALFGQLTRDRENSRRGTFRAFGDILYQTDEGYTERVIADTARGRVVTCENQGSIRLFRVEWTEPDGYQAHKAVYTLHDAMEAFQAIDPPSQRGEG